MWKQNTCFSSNLFPEGSSLEGRGWWVEEAALTLHDAPELLDSPDICRPRDKPPSASFKLVSSSLRLLVENGKHYNMDVK